MLMNNWIIETYEAIGHDHKKRQLPCQDALRQVNTKELILAQTASAPCTTLTLPRMQRLTHWWAGFRVCLPHWLLRRRLLVLSKKN
mgnify:CR=1 FL=1